MRNLLSAPVYPTSLNCEVHTAMMSLMDHANLHVICSRKKGVA